jgi:hypothetical protein
MTNELLHKRTVVALARAACSHLVSNEDLDLLCWHAGVNRDEIKGIQVAGYRMNELIKFIPPNQAARELESRIAEES